MSGENGIIVLLNGAPRAGKSSIVTAMQENLEGLWLNLGVDRYMPMIPEKYQPGIGLRPGGERPDLEPYVERMYLALYASIAAHSRAGINVVADVGHHNGYSQPLNLLPRCASILNGLPALLVGVLCPIEEILRRRNATGYLAADAEGRIPASVLRWQEAVHQPGIYDLSVDTSATSPEESAALIGSKLKDPDSFTALKHLVEMNR